MYRHCLSAAFAIGIVLMSGCNRHDNTLPKTDRHHVVTESSRH